jgi:hypothetical protein
MRLNSRAEALAYSTELRSWFPRAAGQGDGWIAQKARCYVPAKSRPHAELPAIQTIGRRIPSCPTPTSMMFAAEARCVTGLTDRASERHRLKSVLLKSGIFARREDFAGAGLTDRASERHRLKSVLRGCCAARLDRLNLPYSDVG